MAGGGVDASLRAAGNGSMPLKKDLLLKTVTLCGSDLNQHCPAPATTDFSHFLNKRTFLLVALTAASRVVILSYPRSCEATDAW